MNDDSDDDDDSNDIAADDQLGRHILIKLLQGVAELSIRTANHRASSVRMTLGVVWLAPRSSPLHIDEKCKSLGGAR